MKETYCTMIMTLTICFTWGITIAQPINIEGIYSSVYESEWKLKVELKKGGKALISEESWLAGQYQDRVIVETIATWEWINYELLIHYDGITDTLEYDKRLSLEDLGIVGEAPGMFQRFKYHPNSKLKNIKLWKSDYFPFGPHPPQVIIMPMELVEVAEKNGYTQVEDFYELPGMVEPCYIYGYKEGHKENSAVFWARKKDDNERNVCLLFVSRPFGYEPFKIDEVLHGGKYGRGISFFQDTNMTLDEFQLYGDYRVSGPHGVRLTGKGIRLYYDGVVEFLYKYEGKWYMLAYH
ncbi:MAG: hypothetical protein JSU85_11480 [Candidatus Zixiibacteriota bacterium]|nr:MAG: hypothetical protein JSU85_11480 [candidate division Zixibacteria bacterium]